MLPPLAQVHPMEALRAVLDRPPPALPGDAGWSPAMRGVCACVRVRVCVCVCARARVQPGVRVRACARCS